VPQLNTGVRAVLDHFGNCRHPPLLGNEAAAAAHVLAWADEQGFPRQDDAGQT
jgi:hypothetical protein